MTQIAPPGAAVGPDPQTVEVGGVPLAVRRQGTGPPVLFLHGYALTGRWLKVHDRLAEQHDVIAPDLPGFGESPRPDHVTGFDDLVLVLRDLLDALGFDRVHVVGYSFGGWLAGLLAVFYPDRVTSLTLLAPFGVRVPGAPITDVFAMEPGARQALPFNGRTEGHEHLLVDAASPEGFAALYAEAAAAGRFMWNPRYDVKFDHRLPRVRVPALVIAAAQDRVLPPAHPQRWTQLLADARLETVDDAGHALVVQQPQRCADLVSEHVATTQGASR